MMSDAESSDAHLEETLLAACAERASALPVSDAVTERLFFVREQMERIGTLPPTGPCLLASGPKLDPEWVQNNNFEWSIGRDSACDLVLADTRVSRRHVVLKKTSDDWEIEDLGSQNGFRLNGKCTDRALLRSGDVIEIADYAIIFMD